MRSLSTVLLVWLLGGGGLTNAAEHRVLFVGNSYSSANGDEGVAGGYEALHQEVSGGGEAELIAKGGWTLAQHYQDAQTAGEQLHALLGQGKQSWNAVVLQEQSQIPAWHDQAVQDWYNSLKGAKGLDGLCQAAGAQTVFLMTWGRRDGDQSAGGLFPDFPTMQKALAGGYGKYAALLSTPERPVLIAPAGLAWQKVWEDAVAAGAEPLAPEGIFWRLYAPDGSHPSPMGSFLASLVVYATITGVNPETTHWQPAAIAGEEAAYLRAVARRTVLGEEEPEPPEDGGPDLVSPPDLVRPDDAPPSPAEVAEPRETATDTGGTGEGPGRGGEAVPRDGPGPLDRTAGADATAPQPRPSSGGCGAGAAPASPVWLLALLALLCLAALQVDGRDRFVELGDVGDDDLVGGDGVDIVLHEDRALHGGA